MLGCVFVSLRHSSAAGDRTRQRSWWGGRIVVDASATVTYFNLSTSGDRSVGQAAPETAYSSRRSLNVCAPLSSNGASKSYHA
jgi:hypothetical protein